ncbi:Cleavage induced protein [Phytophthora megakarya]|uniref:Cleavage induced protein n=1 Tax=Phytophthora megakarya TaxID=4795 RepID=A0A225W2P1_9STRA|nr:Cleavage induced protein [Phytophthora megakarya]
MEASDRGLCAIWPEKQEFVQVEFDEEELRQIAEFHSGSVEDFSINIRELMSAAFAAIVWAKKWSRVSVGEPIHVRFWIDNASAVCWGNKRSSRNLFAQMVLRLLALFEVQHNFYASAHHIAGSENIMADAGSRVWQSAELAKEFADMSCSWTQVKDPVVCCSSFFVLLRRSEYLFIGKKHHNYVLRLGDIIFQDVDGSRAKPHQAEVVGIRLLGAKKNRFRREERRFRHRSGDKVLCPVTAARGFLGWEATEGTFTRVKFHDAFLRCVVPKLNAWPLARSIVIVDNAKIHCYPELQAAIHQCGSRLLCLPPYCPQLNPIEQ